MVCAIPAVHRLHVVRAVDTIAVHHLIRVPDTGVQHFQKISIPAGDINISFKVPDNIIKDGRVGEAQLIHAIV